LQHTRGMRAAPSRESETVESTEGISEIWFCEPFARWGFLICRVRVRFTHEKEFTRSSSETPLWSKSGFDGERESERKRERRRGSPCTWGRKAFALTWYRALIWYSSPVRPFAAPDVPLLVTGQQGCSSPACRQLSRAPNACAESSSEESTELRRSTKLGRTLCYSHRFQPASRRDTKPIRD